jgi:hypothetical protein
VHNPPALNFVHALKVGPVERRPEFNSKLERLRTLAASPQRLPA